MGGRPAEWKLLRWRVEVGNERKNLRENVCLPTAESDTLEELEFQQLICEVIDGICSG